MAPRMAAAEHGMESEKFSVVRVSEKYAPR
jgi:hypothetical protein